MIGKRIYGYAGIGLPKPGEYGKDERTGKWFAMTPADMLANLAAHDVVEHEDGTITVSPSILVSESRRDGAREWNGTIEKGVWREIPRWHGYLEHGVWREC